jgi:hypothetical protein
VHRVFERTREGCAALPRILHERPLRCGGPAPPLERRYDLRAACRQIA